MVCFSQFPTSAPRQPATPRPFARKVCPFATCPAWPFILKREGPWKCPAVDEGASAARNASFPDTQPAMPQQRSRPQPSPTGSLPAAPPSPPHPDPPQKPSSSGPPSPNSPAAAPPANNPPPRPPPPPVPVQGSAIAVSFLLDFQNMTLSRARCAAARCAV